MDRIERGMCNNFCVSLIVEEDIWDGDGVYN